MERKGRQRGEDFRIPLETQSIVDKVIAPTATGTISLSEFLEKNIDTLVKSGKSGKFIYECFKSEGINLGSYPTFQRVLKQVTQKYKEEKLEESKGE